MRNIFSVLTLSEVCASTVLLSGCFPVVATSMVGGALSIADRRTTGAQAEDQTIEFKAFDRFRERFKSEQISLSVTSYNRTSLLTGFVPNQATKDEAERVVRQIQNVKNVLNYIEIGPPPSVRSYGSDTVLTTRVKAALIEAKDLQANLIKVFTESSTVYLMGLVTEREEKRATEIVRYVSGVRRVVPLFEPITDAELKRLQTQSSGAAAPASGTSTANVAAPTAGTTVTPTNDVGPSVTPIR